MLVYLIIAAELAILYTVFWYVYVHEPRPYKPRRGLWGSYDESLARVSADAHASEDQSLNSSWGSDRADDYLRMPVSLVYLSRSHPTCPLVERKFKQENEADRQMGLNCLRAEETLLQRMLETVGRTIRSLNVKLP